MLIISDIVTDEDPGLRIESFAIIKLRGVTTKFKIHFFHHANFQRTKNSSSSSTFHCFLDMMSLDEFLEQQTKEN